MNLFYFNRYDDQWRPQGVVQPPMIGTKNVLLQLYIIENDAVVFSIKNETYWQYYILWLNERN